MADQVPRSADAAASPVKPRGRRFIVFILVGVVIVAAGGAAAYWFLHRTKAPEAEHKAAPEELGGLVSFDTFLVNLADPGGRSYLRVTLRLLMRTKDQAEAVENDEVVRLRLRSAIIETLSVQSADRLITPEGKAELKRTLVKQVSGLVQPGEVRDVLYSDFVVQF